MANRHRHSHHQTVLGSKAEPAAKLAPIGKPGREPRHRRNGDSLAKRSDMAGCARLVRFAELFEDRVKRAAPLADLAFASVDSNSAHFEEVDVGVERNEKLKVCWSEQV